MNQENNIIDSFFFTRKEYLQIFEINSLLTLNNFMNTRLSNISNTTLFRIFSYGMFEYQLSVSNSPDISLNIISKLISFLKKSTQSKNEVYKKILNIKKIEEFDNIINSIQK